MADFGCCCAQSGKTTAHTDTYHGCFVRLVPDEEIVEVVEFETADPSFRGRVPRSVVQELAPQPPDCGEDPPGAAHGH